MTSAQILRYVFLRKKIARYCIRLLDSSHKNILIRGSFLYLWNIRHNYLNMFNMWSQSIILIEIQEKSTKICIIFPPPEKTLIFIVMSDNIKLTSILLNLKMTAF